MTIRNFLISTAVSAGLLVAAATPVFSEPVACWFPKYDAPAGQSIDAHWCDIEVVNRDGRKVVQLTNVDNSKMLEMIFWYSEDEEPLYATVILDGKKSIWDFEIDEEGDVHVYQDDYSFFFEIPGRQETRPVENALGDGITA